jgi:hypothetical protein
MSTSCEIEFQEICPRTDTGREIEGCMFSGEAELRYNENGDRREFYVSAIRLNGGLWITRKQALMIGSSFDAVVFKTVANELENSKTEHGRYAQSAYSDQVEADMEAA